MDAVISVVFDGEYQADRALARLKNSGVRLMGVTRAYRPGTLERSLFVAYPYGRSFQGTTNKTSNSVPYTSGDTLLMPTPFFSAQPENRARVSLRVKGEQLSQAKGLLLNSGARELHIRYQ